MAYIFRPFIFGSTKASQQHINNSIIVQIRWRKEWKRKPLWMPTAKSKLYRIPAHPHVSQEEKDLVADLLDEYYIKLNSMRKLFQEELKQKFQDEGNTVEKQQESEKEFRLLLEENRKENERIKLIKDETLERLMQEKEMELLRLEEERKLNQDNIKLKVEEIVKNEKEKTASYINYENLEAAIERALENPVNYNFSINVSGSLKWEGKPPLYFEEEMKKRIAESITEH